MRKATAFRGRSEQDRSALVSRLLFLDFGNVPVERLQRDISFPKSTDTARRVPTGCKIARAVTKTIVQKRNDSEKLSPKRLLQLSAAGEVFLEGEQPSESLSADSEIPAPCFWRTGKVGEKSEAFRGRSEQDRSALVSRLLFLDFGNVPVERFQRDISFPKLTDTARRVPTDESYHYFVAEIQNVSRETFFVRDIPLKISFTVLRTRTPHFFLSPSHISTDFFHGKSIVIFQKACYTILNFKSALFGTGTEVLL